MTAAEDREKTREALVALTREVRAVKELLARLVAILEARFL